MKYTINGFSQHRALELKKEVYDNGEKTILKLDCIDLQILRWFVDFFPKMKKLIINGEQYAWVNYTTVNEDLPILGLGKRSLYDRFKKMVSLGILKHEHVKDGGSYSYYGFGDKYVMLIDTDGMKQTSEGGEASFQGGVKQTSEGYEANFQGGVKQTSDPLGSKLPNKDYSIINNSSIINNIYNETFDRFWDKLNPTPNDRKSLVTEKRKKELYELGIDRVDKAIKLYSKIHDMRYPYKRDNFFNEIIDNYLDKTEKDFVPPNSPSYNINIFEEYSTDELVHFINNSDKNENKG